MHSTNKFFKAYDLRGTTPELDFKVYYLAGQALVTEILQKQNLPLKVNVWHDTRLTSELFYRAFISGLLSKDAEVFACGLGSTDMMYAGAIQGNITGAMITASHNPKDDNGLKIVKKIPQMLGLKQGLSLIRDYVSENYDSLEITEKDLIEIEENKVFRKQSIDKLISVASNIGDTKNFAKKMKIVVDAANGMGVFAYEILVKMYPTIDFIPLYCVLDGNFPNHPADPINKENLVDLQKAIKKNNADLGIAFDGDADRAFFVDENGDLINGENLVAVFAENMVEYAENNPNLNLNSAVVYVVSYSRALADTVLMKGGAAIVSKQGHTFVKEKMANYKAIYGGEASGHHYFGEFGFMDSGLLAVTLMLKILNEKNTSPSELCKYYEDKYFTSGEINIRSSGGLTIDDIITKIKKDFPHDIISTLDGVSVFNPNYKFTIRGSNTEPVFRVNIETKIKTEVINSEKILQKIKNYIEQK